jgi:hypothetical protein
MQNKGLAVLLPAPAQSTTQPTAVVEEPSSPSVIVPPVVPLPSPTVGSNYKKAFPIPFAKWQDILKGDVIFSGPMSTVYNVQYVEIQTLLSN